MTQKIKAGALVEFQREVPSGNAIPTEGFVTNVLDPKEHDCTHTYLVIEYFKAKGKDIYHAKADDVKLLSNPKKEGQLASIQPNEEQDADKKPY